MKFSAVTFFLVATIALCCSEETPQDPSANPPPPNQEPAVTEIGTPVGDPVTKTIGPGGGSVSSLDGVLELTIPPGALSQNTNITVQPVTNEAPGGTGLSYNLLPDGTKFTTPATLTFHYTDEDVNGSDPLFLYIAYQDADKTWVSDLKKQNLDTIAKTLSLDINHFTIYSQGTDNILIVGSGMNGYIVEGRNPILKAGNSSLMFMMESFLITTAAGERRTEYVPVPANLVTNWKVNSTVGGNESDGTITGTGTSAVYRAPTYVDRRRTVKISAHVNTTVTTTYRGRTSVIHGLDPVLEVTLIPEEARKYDISISYLDSTISPFYGRKGAEIPVYSDKAKFNLDIRFVNHVVEVEVSNIDNEPPIVVPATKGYNGTDFVWIPDSLGRLNIEGVKLVSFIMPDDSVLHFDLMHKNATSPGGITQSSEDGEIYSRQEPYVYGGAIGFPPSFELDLKKRGAFFDPSQDEDNRGGIHMSVGIIRQ